MSEAGRRILFFGPYGAGQSGRARDVLCEQADRGVRDVLYAVANSTARTAVVRDLVARRGAVFGVRVITLKGLPCEIERRARVRGPAIAGGVLDEVLVERAIRSAARGIDSSMPVGGLAARATAAIAAVEAGGGTREALASALSGIARTGDGPRVLLETWEHLERSRSSAVRTPAQAIRAATGLLLAQPNSILAGCSLIVLEDLPLDGPLDRALIAALIDGAPGDVVATSECAPQLSAAPATRLLAALRAMAPWDERKCARAGDCLSGAGTRVFGMGESSHGFPAPSIPITKLEAAGDAAEVRLAARVILRHLRASSAELPFRPSDVLVVAPAGGRYRALIAEIFPAAGIPISVSAERSAADTGLGSVLLEVMELAIAAAGVTRDRALSLTRTPYVDIRANAADRLEQRIITRGYLGMEEWDALALRAIGPRAANRVNRLKRAMEAARRALTVASSNDDVALVVRRLAKDLRLVGNAYFARRRKRKDGSVDALAASLADQATREDNQSWEVIEEVLDETMPALIRVVPALATQRGLQFAAGWLSLFGRALASESPGIARSVADAVRVTGTGASGGHGARVTIILGLQQKTFPRQPRQDPFLRDDIRRQLALTGMELATTEDSTERERESFARAVATATEALYLSSPASDAEGKPTVASFFIEDLQRAVGTEHAFAVERLGIADVTPRPEDASSRAELLASVAHGVWQRLPETIAAEADRAAAFAAWNGLLTAPEAIAPIRNGRTAPVHPKFDASLFARAPHGTLELSASQLKLLGHCTFQHFVEKILTPASLAAPEYDAREKGSLVHDAMMQWVSIDGWRRGEEALAELETWVTAQAAKLPPATRESPLVRFTIEQNRARLLEFVEGELAVIGIPGAPQPRYNELAFGGRAAEHGERDPMSVRDSFALTVATSLGERAVRFTGSIDRVDVLERDGASLGIAIDYKTGDTSKFYATSMLDGSDLQLRLYLLALEKLWNITPVGALYIGLGDGVRRGVIREDMAAHVPEQEARSIQVMTADQWDAFVHVETPALIRPLIERLVTLDITANPRDHKCGFCDLDALCRYDGTVSRALDV